jgi:hypothetical protein
MAAINFVRNYIDLSTGEGFQFQFLCDRCGSGYLSAFQPASAGLASGAFEAASKLLDAVSGAAGADEGVDRSACDRAREEALARAIDELKPRFHECPRCGQWVDRPCWNKRRRLCIDCEPA